MPAPLNKEESKTFLFTSESVGEGHPDKICDIISDTILDTHLKIDPFCKVAIETLVKNDFVVLAGEISSKTRDNAVAEKESQKINYEEIVRSVVKDIGYDFDDRFDYKTLKVFECLSEQSSDINSAVRDYESNRKVIENEENKDLSDKKEKSEEKEMIKEDLNTNNDKISDKENDTSDSSNELMGAGDQGIMFGYATDETPECMPLTLILAHKIVKELRDLRKETDWIRPDCKSQVTIEYENINGALVPLRIDNIVVSVMHKENIGIEEIRNFIIEKVIKKVVDNSLLVENGKRLNKNIMKEDLLDKIDTSENNRKKIKISDDETDNLLLKDTIYHIQPSGLFVIGGPSSDAGLTGRKIIIDTYGGFGAHGGGCFSGKDATKVDRSAAYYARYIAKSLVKNKICKRVLVQISYAIGLSHPLSIHVDTYNTSLAFYDKEIIEIIKKNFDLRPASIIKELGLRKPIFAETARYGHFGNEKYPWEKVKKLIIEKNSQREDEK